MKVILLSNVAKVGKKYDIVEVKPGYARNFLFVQNLAEPVTASSARRVAEMQKKRMEEENKNATMIAQAVEKMNDIIITFTRAANNSGHLYAGIDTVDLTVELDKALGCALSQEHIILEKPIKEVGEYIVPIEYAGKKGKFKVVVSKE